MYKLQPMINTYKLLTGKKEFTMVNGDYTIEAREEDGKLSIMISYVEIGDNTTLRVKKYMDIKNPLNEYFDELEKIFEAFTPRKFPLVLLMESIIGVLNEL